MYDGSDVVSDVVSVNNEDDDKVIKSKGMTFVDRE